MTKEYESLIPRMAELDVLDFAPDTKEWLDARFDGIGGSDVAAVLGRCPDWFDVSTPLGVYNIKVNRVVTKANWNMRQGKAMEAPIVDAWAEAEGYKVYPVPTLVVRDKPWQRVNLDRIAVSIFDGKAHVVEVKYSQTAATWTEIPEYYYLQVIWQMYITGIHNTAYLVFAGPRTEPQAIEIEYDEGIAQLIAETVDCFWLDHVSVKNPPPAQKSSEFVAAAVKAAIDKNTIDATPEISALAHRRKALKDSIDVAEAEIDEINGQLAIIMEAHQAHKIKGTDFSVSTVSKRGNVNYSEIVKAMNLPDDELDKHRGADSAYLLVRYSK
jgi:putative phage-type endonuclease